LLAETSASPAEPLELDRLPVAACSRDLCIADLGTEGRRWRLLATRSRDLVPIEALARACAEADIVVSDRRLPRTCRPRWLKADRTLLRRTGGLAFTLGQVGRVATVADRVGRHPWAAGR
jgi:competence protein ComEC